MFDWGRQILVEKSGLVLRSGVCASVKRDGRFWRVAFFAVNGTNGPPEFLWFCFVIKCLEVFVPSSSLGLPEDHLDFVVEEWQVWGCGVVCPQGIALAGELGRFLR